MSYIFVDGTEESLTSAGLDELDSIEISGIFIGQDKRFSFRIGNTGTTNANYYVSASGDNSTIITDVDFSDDNGLTFSNTVSISGIEPNRLTERIVGRLTPSDDSYLGVGSFLLKVNEETYG